MALVLLVVSTIAGTDAFTQTPEMTRSYQRGSSLYEAGLYEAAAPYFVRALALSEQEFGANSARTGFILKNLATVYSRLGQYSAAEPLYLRALEIFERTFGPENGLVAEVVNDLSIVYVEQEKFIQAEPLLERVLGSLEQAFGADDPRVAVAAYNYGYASEFLGDSQKARDLYVRALTVWQSQKVLDSDRIAAARARLAGLGRSQERRAPSLAPYLPRLMPGQTPRKEPRVAAAKGARTKPLLQPANDTPAPNAGKGWRVQIAALKTRESAERESARLSQVHAGFLPALSIVEAILPKGTFYRVGTFPLPDRDAATTLCEALKARQQDCIVVRR